MAISPNDDFSAGQVLTAQECNNWPRGIMVINKATSTDATVTVEEVQITGSSFTAVANRNYRLSYFEPYLASPSSAVFTMRIRQTNLAGAELNYVNVGNTFASLFFGVGGISQAITTFTAGSVNVVATLTCSAGTGQAARTATGYGFLLVEDIGTA